MYRHYYRGGPCFGFGGLFLLGGAFFLGTVLLVAITITTMAHFGLETIIIIMLVNVLSVFVDWNIEPNVKENTTIENMARILEEILPMIQKAIVITKNDYFGN